MVLYASGREWERVSPGCKILRDGEDSSKDLIDCAGFDRIYTRAQVNSFFQCEGPIEFKHYTASYTPRTQKRERQND